MSSGPKHEGTFNLNFKSEKSFRRFGVEWMKCNAYLQVSGQIKKPAETGAKWEYDVPYDFKCECKTVLKNFDIAYQGAFKDEDAAAAAPGKASAYVVGQAPLQTLVGSDYTAQLNTCMLPRSYDDEATDVSQPISLFCTQARERSVLGGLRAADASLASGADYDQKPWNLLYGALINSLGASPDTFQLIYPYTTWTWPTQQVGFVSSAQYDFCSTSPQWSAVGAYVSSGDRVNMAYAGYLDVILAATEDPQLKKEIETYSAKLTSAINDYTMNVNQAAQVYSEQVKDNKPTFTDWLGSLPGRGYASRIGASESYMNQAQKNFNAAVAQANTPGLAAAHAQFANQDFYSGLSDPGLSKFPKVPYWQVAQNPTQWVQSILAGDGPGGATMGFTNRDSSYDYSKTWAGSSVSASSFFWSVQVNGSWERVEEFETDNELEVSVEYEAIELIPIQPSDWYNGAFVRSHANGPFVHGYSAYGENDTQAIFGKKGFFGLMKTGMYVAYKPTFTIRVSQSSFQRFLQKFRAATALRIGPVTITAEGGSEQAQWSASEKGSTFTGTSSSESPVILGVTVTRQPAQDSDALLPSSRPAMGNVYSFQDGEGDILARNVGPDAAARLGGYWKALKSPR